MRVLRGQPRAAPVGEGEGSRSTPYDAPDRALNAAARAGRAAGRSCAPTGTPRPAPGGRAPPRLGDGEDPRDRGGEGGGVRFGDGAGVAHDELGEGRGAGGDDGGCRRRGPRARRARRSRSGLGRGRRRRRRAGRRRRGGRGGGRRRSPPRPCARRCTERRAGPSPATTSRARTRGREVGERVDGEVGALLARQAAAQDEQRLRGRPGCAHPAAAGMRSRSTPSGTCTEGAPIRSSSRAAKRVVVTTRSKRSTVPALWRSTTARHRSGPKGEKAASTPASCSWRKTVDGTPAARAQSPSPRSVRRSDTSMRCRGAGRRAARGPGRAGGQRPVAARPGHDGAGQHDVPTPFLGDVIRGFTRGDDDELVARGAVARAERAERGPDATAVRRPGVGDVDDAHGRPQAVRSRTARTAA